MVRITDDFVAGKAAFAAAGVKLPRFDAVSARDAGRQAPQWLHIGPGNLFRALHAQIAQALLDGGDMAGGVTVAGTLVAAEIDDVYTVADNRHLMVVMAPDGALDVTLCASVAQALFAGDDAGFKRLMAVAAAPSLQFVTVTITEKGYATRDRDGQWLPAVAADVAAGPSHPASAMGVVAAALYARFQAGAAPVAMVSTDNFSANGDRFKAAVADVVGAWVAGGLTSPGFAAYVADPAKVSFPCTMIDRITPNPSSDVAARLTSSGIDGMDLVRVTPATVMAPFANTEPTWYLVVEDDFPGGRPPLERAGVLMADKQTVNLTDEMKVTACLNPLHTALAVFGLLLGFDRIWREVGDPDLASLVRRLGESEMLPVCPDPGIIEPARFLAQVIDERLPNPALPDAPGRIAADTSQKLPIRFGVALRRHIEAGTDLASLRAVPLVLAGWLRYLMGVDDDGAPMTPSPDPRLDELTSRLAGLKLGADNTAVATSVGLPLLGEVLGVDVSATPLASVIVDDLNALTAGPGAVRATLHALAVGE